MRMSWATRGELVRAAMALSVAEQAMTLREYAAWVRVAR